MGELSRACWVIALAGGFIAVSCGHSPDTTTQGPGPRPVPADIQQVCTNFVTTALSVDTIADHTPADARRRAALGFGVPDLDKNLTGDGRDPDWPLLQSHRAHVSVSTQPVADDPPPVRANQAAAGVRVSRIATGSDGWRQTLPSVVAYCALRQESTGWKVAALTLSDDGATP